MTLAPGTKLGPYAIVAPLGAGGMGEVYRARDTRLDREVAVKVLPEEMARNADARARFEREAKAVAALSHPNILAVYDVGREQDVSYVVTELLDGETLRERLERQVLPARKAFELDPGFPLALMHKSWLCWTTGDVEGFFAARQRLGKVSVVANVPVSELRRAYANGGREAVARMVLASEEAGRSPVERARWHTALGELDAAFDDLEQALKERAVWLPFTAHYHLRELRRDPRYDVLRAQLNLPEAD